MEENNKRFNKGDSVIYIGDYENKYLKYGHKYEVIIHLLGVILIKDDKGASFSSVTNDFSSLEKFRKNRLNILLKRK